MRNPNWLIRYISNTYMQICCFLLFCFHSLLLTSFIKLAYAAEPSIDSLLSLPYVQQVEKEDSPEKSGVTIYKKNKTWDGYNFYTAGKIGQYSLVNLTNMNGQLVHQWRMKKKQRAHTLSSPLPDGSILLLTIDSWAKININSKNIALYKVTGQKPHHGCYPLKEGGFLGIYSNIIKTPFRETFLNIKDNSLIQTASDGRITKKISLYNLFKNNTSHKRRLELAYRAHKKFLATSSVNKSPPLFDLFHVNNIDRLEWDIPGIAKKGDWLATIRNLNRIIVINPKTEKIVWEWGESIIDFPHHATFLDENKILLFDNGPHQKSSRVVILDIRSKEIIWQYGQRPGQEFFSKERGSAQKLPNGNILIAEANKGRVFEVTSSGEIVWEYYGKISEKRHIIPRIIRLPYDFFKDVKFNYGKIDP